MLKLTNKLFRQLNHHNITLTCNIDDTYQELYDTRLDLNLHTKSLTQMYHSPKPLTLHIRSSRIQKTDTKHHYKPLTDHKSSSSRTDDKPITCEEDGLTQREFHQLLHHIYTKDPKECYLHSPFFIRYKVVRERINQYNLKLKLIRKSPMIILYRNVLQNTLLFPHLNYTSPLSRR